MKSIENLLTFALGGVIVYLLVKTKANAVQADAPLNEAEENESFTEMPKVFVEKARQEASKQEKEAQVEPAKETVEQEVVEAIQPKRRSKNERTVGRQRLVILDNTPFPIHQAGLGFDVDEMSDPSCGV